MFAYSRKVVLHERTIDVVNSDNNREECAYLNVLVEVLDGLQSHLHALLPLSVHLLHSVNYKIDLTLHAYYECTSPEDGVWTQRKEPVREPVSTD